MLLEGNPQGIVDEYKGIINKMKGYGLDISEIRIIGGHTKIKELNRLKSECFPFPVKIYPNGSELIGNGILGFVYLKYTIFFLIFALLGCETQKNMEIVTFKSYFNSNLEELWKDGLEYFKLNMDENSLEDMMSIYLNKKFSLVDDEMEILIKTFLITFDPEYEKFLTFFEDADNIPSLIDLILISTFEDQYIISFAKKLYKQSASESKSKISESLGRTILNLSHVKLLYDDQDQDVRLGTIFSAGYIPGSE
ncbi:MAG: hypothetical protein B6229_09555, partial [Spirochaetaceae bacterium 4572_7]